MKKMSSSFSYCSLLLLFLLLATVASTVVAAAQDDDYYKILGVPRTATQREIKKKYRSLARKLHPDFNQADPNAKDRFQRINKAYDTLSDAEKRKTYDLFGEAGDRMDGDGGMGGFGGGPHGGGGFSGGPHGGGGGGMPFTGTHFDSFFRFQKPKARSQSSKQHSSGSFSSSSSSSTFSFQKAFGSSIYKEPLEAEDPGKKKGGFFDSLFSQFDGGEGAGDSSSHQDTKQKKQTAKKGKRSAADFASDDNFRHKASAGQKPAQDDFEDLGKDFFGRDAPPQDMFSGQTAPPKEESPEFMSWFETKFGSGPSGAATGPTKKTRKKKKATAGSASNDQRKKQKTSRGGKDSRPWEEEKNDEESDPSSFFNGNHNSFDPSSFQHRQRQETKQKRKVAANIDHAVLHLFSMQKMDRHCVAPGKRQRCLVIFAASATYMSANVTFGKAVATYHTAERRRELVGKHTPPATPTSNTLFLFVPKTNVTATTVLLLLRMSRLTSTSAAAASDQGSLTLCGAYGNAQQQQQLTGEYCVIALRPVRSGGKASSDEAAATRKMAVFGRGVVDAESASISRDEAGASSFGGGKKSSRTIRSAQDLQSNVLDAMEAGDAKWFDVQIEQDDDEVEERL